MAIGAVIATQAWTARREILKRRMEYVEDVLACFYETEDAIRAIRSPIGYSYEGKSRVRDESEKPEESERLDSAYIFHERYRQYESVFASLRAKKARFRAVFGSEYSEPFEKIDHILVRIHSASRMLWGYYYKPQRRLVSMTDEEFEKRMQKTQEQEAILWIPAGQDAIALEVHDAVQRIEKVSEAVARESQSSGVLVRWKSFVDQT